MLIGGTEQGTVPNSDIMFGGPGDDINLWVGGDGSKAFLGGRGLDALFFGTIDRDAQMRQQAPTQRSGRLCTDQDGTLLAECPWEEALLKKTRALWQTPRCPHYETCWRKVDDGFFVSDR